MELRVTTNSQTDRLRRRAEDAQLRHGQEVRADLSRVRVERHPASLRSLLAWLWRGARGPKPGPVGDVFFCEIGPITVLEQIAAGDGGPIPATVVLDGLVVGESGYYDLRNVLVRSNGDLQLVADERTHVTLVGWAATAFPPF